MKKFLSFLTLTAAVSAFAAADTSSLSQLPAGSRVGLGQATAKEPAMLGNLNLSDPLVQRKYLNEPDLLRFLRGTYSEACVRGMMNQATKQVAADLKRDQSPENKAAAERLVASKRIWKLTSFELEAMFGASYMTAASYCDCIMKEVPDSDLVNPRKGKEVVEKLSKTVQRSCEMSAKEQTDRYLKKSSDVK